jgi:hypothetical protein
MCRRVVLPPVTAVLLVALPCAAFQAGGATCSADGSGAAVALGIQYEVIRMALGAAFGVPPGGTEAPPILDALDLLILGNTALQPPSSCDSESAAQLRVQPRAAGGGSALGYGSQPVSAGSLANAV